MQHLQPISFLFTFLLSSSVSRALDCKLNNTNPYKVAYTITVDQSRKGNFTTIQSAIDSVPSGNDQWIHIQVSPGIYVEKVTVPEDKQCIFLDGASSRLTVIQWGDHEQTDTSATFYSFSDNFVARGITFKNTFKQPKLDGGGNLKQALAIRLHGDKSALYHCGFIGLQDTVWDAEGRHYFNKCYIEGAVDFIFGSGQSIYEGCVINVTIGLLAPEYSYGIITAQGRNSSNDPSGFVFKYCTVIGGRKAYLGRAYGAYSRVIFEQSVLSDVVIPQGWDSWNYTGHEENFVYVEDGCTGPGADTSKRVPWLKKIRVPSLKEFVNKSFIDQEGWIAKLPKVF